MPEAELADWFLLQASLLFGLERWYQLDMQVDSHTYTYRFDEWRHCPLDVSALALYSVTSAVEAAQCLADARGVESTFTLDISQIPFSFSSLENLEVQNRKTVPWSPLSGFFKTLDGWVRLHGNYPHHAKALTECFGTNDRENLTKLFLSLPKHEIEESIILNGGIASAVRSSDEWNQTDQSKEMIETAWIKTEVSQKDNAPPNLTDYYLPASGIRVLDLTRVVAGPTCTQILACLGADVLRIDPPSMPELEDQYISNSMGKNTAIVDFSHNKKMINSLISQAHVVILGYSPHSLDKFGLSLSKLRNKYPDLLIASLSAWGESGPWATRAGFDSIVQAATGISHLCSTVNSDGELVPGALPVQALDHSTGFILAARILESLAYNQSGVVHISLLGAAQELFKISNTKDSDRKYSYLATHHNISNVDSPYGQISVPAIPIKIDGMHLEGKIKRYGSSYPNWFSL
ncbi:CoA transferase [Rothia nasimurium]|uniref:CoA transferase n=1 Tax=Rothia nasimurium TaxID=85336 RepID=UPI001179BC0C|nr:CoA transferase [Rothia nasimurium]